MCGIIGVFGNTKSPIDISDELALLKSRGPDSQQIEVVSERLVMGAARLAMTDPLPRSNQPMKRDGCWIAFNGEIYNHNELRRQLSQEFGTKFSTLSDTEVLLRMLQKYGEQASKYLNGMYAFAFYDSSRKKLLLGRDHLGKKPLYFTIRDEMVSWCSALEPLRRIIKRRELNQLAILEYLSFGYSLDPQTFDNDIFAIEPGSIYSFNDNLEHEVTSSPRYIFEAEAGYSIKEALNDAVNQRIDSHENAAISLSGGLDSSIVAFLARGKVSNLQTYSLRWKDSDKARYNVDYEAAKRIAESLNLPFVGVDFEEYGTVESNLEKFVSMMGEPNSNPTGISLVPLYSRIAEDHHRLVLTGDGSDEIFGGYPRYESFLVRNSIRIAPEALGRMTIAQEGYKSPSVEIAKKLILAFLPARSAMLWSNFQWNFSLTESAMLMEEDTYSGAKANWENLESAIHHLDGNLLIKGRKAVQNVMGRDHNIWLNNESNRKLDRISMGFSIEARSPFQDDRVINMAMKDMEKTHYKKMNKSVLRECFPELENVGIRKDKAGFISPVGHWIRSNPNLIDNAFSTLLDAKIFRNDHLLKRKNDHLSGDYRKISQLWSLIVLGYWLKSFTKS